MARWTTSCIMCYVRAWITLTLVIGFVLPAPAQTPFTICDTPGAMTLPGSRIGALQLGMSESAARKILEVPGVDLNVSGDTYSAVRALSDLHTTVWISRGVVEDIQVGASLYCKTPEGIGTGSHPAQILHVYGQPSRSIALNKNTTVLVYDDRGVAFTIIPFVYAGVNYGLTAWTIEVFHPRDFCRIHSLARRAGLTSWDCSTPGTDTSSTAPAGH